MKMNFYKLILNSNINYLESFFFYFFLKFVYCQFSDIILFINKLIYYQKSSKENVSNLQLKKIVEMVANQTQQFY